MLFDGIWVECVELLELTRQWWPLVPANGRASPDTRLMPSDGSFPRAWIPLLPQSLRFPQGFLVFLSVLGWLREGASFNFSSSSQTVGEGALGLRD